MTIPRNMRRLLHVLEIEEEQRRAEMESALGDLRRLERALEATEEREREGRRLVLASAATGEVVDRLAGLEESRVARRVGAALKPRIAETQAAASARRRDFLTKRIERRQAETVIRKAEAAEATAAGRRGQRDQDEWFLSKTRRETSAPSTPKDAAGSTGKSKA